MSAETSAFIDGSEVDYHVSASDQRAANFQQLSRSRLVPALRTAFKNEICQHILSVLTTFQSRDDSSVLWRDLRLDASQRSFQFFLNRFSETQISASEIE